MSEVAHYPHTPTGLIKAYVAARIAQYDRVNKFVKDQYANDVQHYKDGADMDRPEPPQIIVYDREQIGGAFSRFEDALTIWIVEPSDEMPQLVDGEMEMSTLPDLLEGYTRTELELVSSTDDEDTYAPPLGEEMPNEPKAFKSTRGKKSKAKK